MSWAPVGPMIEGSVSIRRPIPGPVRTDDTRSPMSSTFEAAAAATLVQLVAAGFTVEVGAHGMESRNAWTVTISKRPTVDGVVRVAAIGQGRYPLEAFAIAASKAMNDREFTATTCAVLIAGDAMADAWRTIVCIAEAFEFVLVKPTMSEPVVAHGLPVTIAVITCNGSERTWTIGEVDEPACATRLDATLERLHDDAHEACALADADG